MNGKDHENVNDIGTETDLGPKIVMKNYYAFGSSNDSRIDESKEPKRSSLKNSKLEGMEFESNKSLPTTNQKKSVQFNLSPEVFLVKNYKLFNRTGSHQTSCLCKIF